MSASTPERPGTVTFLMTDVEGSTPLWESDGDAMRAAMRLHDDAIEATIDAAGGVVVKPRGEGDSRFCVFSSAVDAVDAALQVQRTLSATTWPTTQAIRVRIGIYSGHAERSDDGDYYGTAPNRCARLRDLGHGGQVLVSASTAAMIGALDDGAALLPLGPFRLRGVEIPEPVFQLTHPSIPSDFPPLRAPTLGNVPEPISSFVGRTDEIQNVTSLVESRRLVTLTGAAGVGKTRLGIEVARAMRSRRPHGTWFVEFASIANPEELVRAVIAAFELPQGSDRTPSQILADYLRDKDLVIVLDNCEHVLPAAASLVTQILTAPGVRVIATSREPLGAAGEVVWRVASLDLPDPDVTPAELRSFSAAELFVARARDADPRLTIDEHGARAIARICHRLDGIPLAIELAAGRADVIDLPEIATQVEQHFDLVAGAPRSSLERQQTLRTALDWSYDLLTPSEREVLARLGAFAGSFTLRAAADVCEGPHAPAEQIPSLVTGLIRKSLVTKDEHAGRYRLLQMVGAYARERAAASGSAGDTARAHLRHFADVGATVRGTLEGGPERSETMSALALDHEDLAKALRFATTAAPEVGLQLAVDIGPYLLASGHWTLGRDNLERLLDAAHAADLALRAHALELLGSFAESLGDNDTAGRCYEDAIIAAVGSGDRRIEAQATGSLAHRDANMGALDRAEERFERALLLARAIQDEDQIARWIGGLGTVATYRSDYPGARARYLEALAIAKRRSAYAQVTTLIGNLASLDYHQGDHTSARARFEEALAMARSLGDRRYVTFFIGNLGIVCHHLGDYPAAQRFYGEALSTAREIGDLHVVSILSANLGEIDHALGDPVTARSRLEESLTIARSRSEAATVVGTCAALIHVALDEGDLADARARCAEALALARDLGAKAVEEATRSTAFVAAAAGDAETATVLAAGAQHISDEIGFALWAFGQQRLDRLLSDLRGALGSDAFEDAWARGGALSTSEVLDTADRFVSG